MLGKIISGGLAGVEIAALDVAIKLGIPQEGWAYKGRKTEEGVLSDQYNVREIANPSFYERIEKNIIDADGTVILTFGQLLIVSKEIAELARKHGKPCLHVKLIDCSRSHAIASIRKWMTDHEVETVYFTGSKPIAAPNVYQESIRIIEGIYRVETEQEKLPGFQDQDYLK
jgi:hypothetical protein